MFIHNALLFYFIQLETVKIPISKININIYIINYRNNFITHTTDRLIGSLEIFLLYVFFYFGVLN